jgi:hypothetical protein
MGSQVAGVGNCCFRHYSRRRLSVSRGSKEKDSRLSPDSRPLLDLRLRPPRHSRPMPGMRNVSRAEGAEVKLSLRWLFNIMAAFSAFAVINLSLPIVGDFRHFELHTLIGRFGPFPISDEIFIPWTLLGCAAVFLLSVSLSWREKRRTRNQRKGLCFVCGYDSRSFSQAVAKAHEADGATV